MKKLLLYLFILLQTSLYSQTDEINFNDFYHNFSIGASLSVGREDIVAIYPPKISFTYFDINNSGIETFIGLNIAAWPFFGYHFSTGIHTGLILKNKLSFEGSFTYATVPPQDAFFEYFNNTWQKVTFNPKIGLKADIFWIKAGPSFILSSNEHNAAQTFFDPYNIRYYNLEMGLYVPLRIPNYKKIHQFNNRAL
ncbi:MAG: hypothetical protein JXR27_11705 [Paludibacteraceae bacterium]|nr:hypothetical protein [Paludibacteraceae bacterium]